MPYNWDATFEIRDIRNGQWYWVQKEVLASKLINASTKLVYSALAYYTNNKTQRSSPSYTAISELIDVSRNTVIKGVKNLIEHGFISKKQRDGRVNYYELLKLTSAKFAPVPKEGQGSATIAPGSANGVRKVQGNNIIQEYNTKDNLKKITKKDRKEIYNKVGKPFPDA
jgi:DNA-binding MarR family transcriptional regulator